MKLIRKKVVLIIAMLLVFTLALSLVACNKDKNKNPNPNNPEDGPQQYNPETRPFSMSISTPDGVFNPYFSTSAYDSTILGMTQIGMLNTDKDGNIVCGVNEPTVALDYSIVEGDDDQGHYTDYTFVIKNGIKFSDGEPLTIKDVLFNLYVYLDPVYTGSSTIYSTDIRGLKQYRTQDENTSDSFQNTFEESFITPAQDRIQAVVDFIQCFGTGVREEDKPWKNDWRGKTIEDPMFDGYKEDISEVAAEFLKELISDYNAINMEDYKDWHGFTAPWQIFWFNDGGETGLLQLDDETGAFKKDDNGNYYLNETYANNLYEEMIERLPSDVNQNDPKALEEAIKKYSIESVFEGYIRTAADLSTTGNIYDDDYKLPAIQYSALRASVSADNLYGILHFWGTANTILQNWIADAKSDYFGSHETLQFPTITGIMTDKTSSFKGQPLNGEHDVLIIRINDIDPKAIYNFSFTVSPLHYYSSHNYEGVDYINGFNGDQPGGTNFGVKYGDSDFMQNVLNATSKIGVPIGAGAYMASKDGGGAAKEGEKNQFFNNNIIYYERNPYFWTVGCDGGDEASSPIQNAKIKTIYYKVVETDQVINALKGNSIDYGEPNATPEHQEEVIDAGLNQVTITTAGYGYVGINPRFVPDINVRRAIMKAFDTSMVINNYYHGLAEIIKRPMTSTSWAYPDDAEDYISTNGPIGYNEGSGAGVVSYSFDSTGDEIEALVKAAGYTLQGGVYSKNIQGFGEDRLDYKFTIAGSSDDHPAYNMFLRAAQILNAHGFDVQVVTSATALSDLSAGKLEVWAAAWSSTIDPDMYQVYHKDSQASSTNNWGYNVIIAGKNTDAYRTEYDIITRLSALIDEARETNEQDDRAVIYSDCLDLVMELAVEFPTYNRSDMSAFSDVLDKRTLPKYEGSDKEISPYSGLLSRIWEINYV